jgi:hypothetical protein
LQNACSRAVPPAATRQCGERSRRRRLDLLAIPRDAVNPIGIAAVSAAAAPNAVDSTIAVDSDPVVAGAAVDEVLAVAGGEVVVTRPSVQPIVVPVRDDRVVARSSDDEVAAVRGGDVVVAGATPDSVVACAGEDAVRLPAADDAIGSVGAVEAVSRLLPALRRTDPLQPGARGSASPAFPFPRRYASGDAVRPEEVAMTYRFRRFRGFTP